MWRKATFPQHFSSVRPRKPVMAMGVPEGQRVSLTLFPAAETMIPMLPRLVADLVEVSKYVRVYREYNRRARHPPTVPRPFFHAV